MWHHYSIRHDDAYNTSTVQRQVYIGLWAHKSHPKLAPMGELFRHDDVIKWNIFRVTGHLCGNSPVNSPHKGQWREALMFSLISAWINGWVNNREAGDLGRHRAHYDVIVMRETEIGEKQKSVHCRYIAVMWHHYAINHDSAWNTCTAKVHWTLNSQKSPHSSLLTGQMCRECEKAVARYSARSSRGHLAWPRDIDSALYLITAG